MNLNSGRASSIPPLSRYAFDSSINKHVTNRPQTSERFPDRRSRNPFFVRNNPHPNKVCHMKGLLDAPVCVVYDTNFGNMTPRDKKRAHTAFPMKREKFVPGMGLVNTQPLWFEELQNFTQKVGLRSNQIVTLTPFHNKPDENIIQKDRLPSRLSSRQSNSSVVNSPRSSLSSRHSSSRSRSSALNRMENDFVRQQCNNEKDKRTNNYNGNEVVNALKQDLAGKCIIQVDDKESFVFHLLTKILRTDSMDDIKQWLLQAPSKEKDTVLDMVRALSKHNNDGTGEESRPFVPGVEYEPNFLYHESSLDPEVYRMQRERKSSPRNPMLEQIAESVQLDIDINKNMLGPSNNLNSDIFFPKIAPEHTEIEEIRSRLVSRGSLNVLGTARK